MKLHHDVEVFKELTQATAQDLGVPTFYIEKDYWVTQCLKQIANDHELSECTIFKGGTALSKVHGIIQRFSEDCDFAVTEKIYGDTQTQCKKTLKKIQDISRSHPDINKVEKKTEEISGNQEFKRFCTYNALFPFPRNEYSQSREEIIIEVNSFGVPRPYKKHEVMSYIAKFCFQNQQSLIEQYDLGPFMLYVIEPERAFLDKVIAIQKAFFKYENNERKERDWFISKMRHLYDIAKLVEINSVKVVLKNLQYELEEVIKNDSGKCTVDEIKRSDLYSNPHTVLKSFANDWQRLTPMLYKKEKLPSIEEIGTVLELIKKSL